MAGIKLESSVLAARLRARPAFVASLSHSPRFQAGYDQERACAFLAFSGVLGWGACCKRHWGPAAIAVAHAVVSWLIRAVCIRGVNVISATSTTLCRGRCGFTAFSLPAAKACGPNTVAPNEGSNASHGHPWDVQRGKGSGNSLFPLSLLDPVLSLARCDWPRKRGKGLPLKWRKKAISSSGFSFPISVQD